MVSIFWLFLGALLILWSLQARSPNAELGMASTDASDQNGSENQETWNPIVICRIADSEDIYDLKWSPCGSFIILALTNNNTVIWCYSTGNAHACYPLGKITRILRDHSHFVQGISLDPLGFLFATQSSDRYRMFLVILRSVKVYSYENHKKFSTKCIHILSRVPSNQCAEVSGKPTYAKLFNDETLVTFFRRLSFSPDGSILATPCGIIADATSPFARRQHLCLFLYSRASLLTTAQAMPSIVLGPFDKAPVVVRFHPSLFQLIGGTSLISLPYAMVFAVGTQDSVIIYRTDRASPLVVLNGMHFAAITDLCWTKICKDDSIVLVISSTDGFCSSIVFENNELGTIYAGQVEETIVEPEETIVEPEETIVEPKETIVQSAPCISSKDVVRALSSSISKRSLEAEIQSFVC
ncbi:hypothetical protein DI09_213p40 [Mitosporidium daphniae]|uniref:CAF1B/HIR1 beta-propeller domain-containing protein n=1 Tax=Mitosporidium daphniae TaxID=1485682 RepID=A0A098VWD9_9MICR|nr:uncharacterized protein DI09_213p40 [Mitosporidium daphniae]KGG52076.1 hypothetical protein DI09_213p40 [Mitosporidium daphniae]|eukprot:XP_013238512.1 uncharacterized protein DI09_213p40 [Mitosporidium daphniae]